MKKIIFLFVLCLIGCVSATVYEPNACSSNELGTIPASPIAGVQVPPVSFSHPADLSDALGKLSDVSSNMTVNVNQLQLSSDVSLAWVNRVDVSIKGETTDLPDVSFGTYLANGDPGTTINLQTNMSSSEVLRYLSHPVTLTFTVSGTASTQEVKLTNTMCVGASGQFSKSL